MSKGMDKHVQVRNPKVFSHLQDNVYFMNWDATFNFEAFIRLGKKLNIILHLSLQPYEFFNSLDLNIKDLCILIFE